jgi:hypothetical protein
MANPKHTASLLIAALGKPMGMRHGMKMESPEEDSTEVEPNLAEEAFKSACRDTFDAIKADSFEKFCSSLSDVLRAHEDVEAPEDD